MAHLERGLLSIGNNEHELRRKNCDAGGVVVGIDLGTTNSVVSLNGAVLPIGNVALDQSNEVLDQDNVASWQGNTASGQSNEALNQNNGEETVTARNPLLAKSVVALNGVIFSGFKRHLENPDVPFYSDSAPSQVGDAPSQSGDNAPFRDDAPSLGNSVPFRSDSVPSQSGNSAPGAVVLSAALLRVIKERTEKYLQQQISGAVITVPARFSNIARDATKRAAKMAGINVIRLVNEPTAAAIAYGLNSADGVFLIYDFGGGTFDATILRIECGVFQVLATDGDLRLGGDDIDEAILVRMGLEKSKENIDFARVIKEGGGDEVAVGAQCEAAVGAQCEAAVDALGELQNCEAAVSAQGEVAVGAQGEAAVGALQRAAAGLSVSAVALPFVNRTLEIISKILRNLMMSPDDIDGVVLVGGTSRLACVRQKLAEMFGEGKIKNTVDPDTAVAIGAGIHAETIASKNFSVRPLLLDVVPSGLGIETMMGCVETIIPKYTPTPASAKMQFSTFYDNQTEILIHVVQGDHVLAQNCTSLGRFVLGGIQPLPGGKPRICVVFNVDEDGILKIEASEELSGVKRELIVDFCSNHFGATG
jgi:molecular chaperone HscA